MKRYKSLLCLLLAALLCGCGKTEPQVTEPSVYEEPVSSDTQPQSTEDSIPTTEVTWDIPTEITHPPPPLTAPRATEGTAHW